MKIFAKRKKTVKPSAEKTFASDPIVEELLKKDSSEWNAKEKRMVKRYQQRIAESKSSDGGKEEEAEEAVEKNNEEAEEKEGQSLELSSVLEASVLEALNSKQKRKLSRTLSQQGKSAIDEVVQEATQIVQGEKKEEETPKDDKADSKPAAATATPTTTADEIVKDNLSEMDQIKELLKGLNSKQKRTLTRRLEREGESCLAEVKEEAEKMLKGASDDSEQAKKAAVAPAAKAGKKRKRSRGAADLSGLTPEERVRREEQRKMQKEAAERRENGEDTSAAKFKHPLNSERRRANRRKPKWMPKSSFANDQKVEHHSSGFHMRKLEKADNQG